MVVVITKSVLLAQFTLDAEGKVAQNNSRNSLQLYGFLAAPTIVPDSERQEGLPPQIGPLELWRGGWVLKKQQTI